MSADDPDSERIKACNELFLAALEADSPLRRAAEKSCNEYCRARVGVWDSEQPLRAARASAAIATCTALELSRAHAARTASDDDHGVAPIAAPDRSRPTSPE